MGPVFSTLELANSATRNIYLRYETTYYRLAKLSPDDETLTPVSCRTPRLVYKQLPRDQSKHQHLKFRPKRWPQFGLHFVKTFLILCIQGFGQPKFFEQPGFIVRAKKVEGHQALQTFVIYRCLKLH